MDTEKKERVEWSGAHKLNEKRQNNENVETSKPEDKPPLLIYLNSLFRLLNFIMFCESTVYQCTASNYQSVLSGVCPH